MSPKTGRVYVVYQAGNPALGMGSEDIAGHHPLIQANVSDDAGNTWSQPATLSTTPTNIPEYSQQAFNANVVVLDNGYLGLIYVDFRNNKSGPNQPNGPVIANIWLDIYKGCEDRQGW